MPDRMRRSPCNSIRDGNVGGLGSHYGIPAYHYASHQVAMHRGGRLIILRACV